MRGSDKALAPLDETLESGEPGALLPEAGALKPDAGSDDAEPRVVYVGDGAADGGKPADDEEKVVAEMTLTVPETDPERLAYTMWNEGRADEAIDFLERHLAAERDRRRQTALVPASAEGKDAIHVEPATDWRERHRTALSAADFNAFGVSSHTIDITPTHADAVVPHTVRGSLRVGWLMGVCLAVLGVSAAGVYFLTRDRDIATTLLAASEGAIADLKPATAAPAAAEPEVELAAVDPDADAADVPPPDEARADARVADTSPAAADEAIDIPPEDATAVDAAAIPPRDITPRDDIASAPPVDASLLPAPPGASAGETPAADVSEPEAAASQTMASIGPLSEAAESAPIVEARLPRSRPEPPASFTERASAPQVVELEPPLPASELPLVVSEPPPTEAEVASVESDVPVYGPDGPVRIYRHIRRMPYPPIVNRTFPRRSLTPAEYQALVERRAWAERYAAERRTGIVGRILTFP